MLLAREALNMTRRFLWPAAAVVLLSNCRAKPAIDPKDPFRDPVALTYAVLDACKTGDVVTFQRVLAGPRGADGRPTDEAEMRIARANLEGDHTHCFRPSDWRTSAIASWDGHLRESRLHDGELRIWFADLNPDQIVIASLFRQGDGQWRFDDVRSMPRARFEALGEPFSP